MRLQLINTYNIAEKQLVQNSCSEIQISKTLLRIPEIPSNRQDMLGQARTVTAFTCSKVPMPVFYN